MLKITARRTRSLHILILFVVQRFLLYVHQCTVLSVINLPLLLKRSNDVFHIRCFVVVVVIFVVDNFHRSSPSPPPPPKSKIPLFIGIDCFSSWQISYNEILISCKFDVLLIRYENDLVHTYNKQSMWNRYSRRALQRKKQIELLTCARVCRILKDCSYKKIFYAAS